MARDYRGAEVGGSLAGSASGASLGESSGPKHSLAAHIALYFWFLICLCFCVSLVNSRSQSIRTHLVRFIYQSL